ncbi:MAG: hypothetical protein E6J88_19060 [Deltaproteobacteria bacterium]|nr:MAG: hypothetical protein E6J88_19060 [Deltaproteobacteria bacterium]
MQRLLAALLLLAACKKSPPRFCDQDLTGVWLNASDKHFAYRFRDHGDVIRGEFLESQEDGGLANPPDPVTFEMHRTSDTLAGVMRSTEATASGRVCPVEFGINLTTCSANHVQAQVEMDVPVADDCKRKTAEDGGDLPPHRTEFVFVRDARHPSGGGETPVAH